MLALEDVADRRRSRYANEAKIRAAKTASPTAPRPGTLTAGSPMNDGINAATSGPATPFTIRISPVAAGASATVEVTLVSLDADAVPFVSRSAPMAVGVTTLVDVPMPAEAANAAPFRSSSRPEAPGATVDVEAPSPVSVGTATLSTSLDRTEAAGLTLVVDVLKLVEATCATSSFNSRAGSMPGDTDWVDVPTLVNIDGDAPPTRRSKVAVVDAWTIWDGARASVLVDAGVS